jgi:hypothetical protein
MQPYDLERPGMGIGIDPRYSGLSNLITRVTYNLVQSLQFFNRAKREKPTPGHLYPPPSTPSALKKQQRPPRMISSAPSVCSFRSTVGQLNGEIILLL